MTIPRPSDKQVERHLKCWKELDGYPENECFLKELFTEIYSENADVDEVLIKICSLDSLYSTNIGPVNAVSLAEHIVGLEIDRYTKSITGSDSTLVNEIALVEGKNLFSFATKYCSFHFQEEDCPIYDSHVKNMLEYFKNKDGFSEFTRPRTKTDPINKHPKFYEVMGDFKKYYELKADLRDIEKYLWHAAKYKYKL